MKKLGVLLCYNDGDFLKNAIEALANSGHDLVVWDHGSSDNTSEILDFYKDSFLERKYVPRSFDFYKIYPAMSKNLINNYIDKYDWVSWPDQDEILEGPDRKKTYSEYLEVVYESGYDYISFNNFNFWFTKDDDITISNPEKRIKHYCIFADCSPRIRSWRASKTNIRLFNHNPAGRYRYPVNFNLRHYPMRTREQMSDRLFASRAGLAKGSTNSHYENMKSREERLNIEPSKLHFDTGEELSHQIIFDWRENIYGFDRPKSSFKKFVYNLIGRK